MEQVEAQKCTENWAAVSSPQLLTCPYVHVNLFTIRINYFLKYDSNFSIEKNLHTEMWGKCCSSLLRHRLSFVHKIWAFPFLWRWRGQKLGLEACSQGVFFINLDMKHFTTKFNFLSYCKERTL